MSEYNEVSLVNVNKNASMIVKVLSKVDNAGFQIKLKEYHYLRKALKFWRCSHFTRD